MARSHDSDQRFMSIFDHFWRSFWTLARFGSAIYEYFLIISGRLFERSHDSDQRFMSIFWSFLESAGALPRFGTAIYAQFDHFWRSFGTLPRFGSAISDHFWSFLEVFWSAPTIRISDLSSVLIISGALLAVFLTRGPDAPARWPRARGPWRERERERERERYRISKNASASAAVW